MRRKNPILRRLPTAVLAAGLALTLAGCWTLSIHPLYSEDVGVPPGALAPDLVGLWGDPEDPGGETWQFLDDGAGAYRLIVRDAGGDLLPDPTRDGIFEARLLRLEGRLLLDLFPAEPEGVNEYFLAHVIPAHSFLRLDLQGHALTLSLLDQTWLKQSLESGLLDLPYQMVDGTLVLTADTPRLQAAFAPHLEAAFGDPETMQRLQ